MMSETVLNTQAQASVQSVQPSGQTSVVSSNSYTFANVKAKVVWAWEATVESVKSAFGAVADLVQRVWSAVRGIFSGLVERAQKSVAWIRDQFSLKFGSRSYVLKIAELEKELEDARRANQQLAAENARLRPNGQADDAGERILQAPPSPEQVPLAGAEVENHGLFGVIKNYIRPKP